MQFTLTNLLVILVVGAAFVLIVSQLLANAKAKSKKDDRFGEYYNGIPDNPLGTKGSAYDPTKKSVRRFAENVKYWFKTNFGD